MEQLSAGCRTIGSSYSPLRQVANSRALLRSRFNVTLSVDSVTTKASMKKVSLKVKPLTSEAFKPFGQVIGATQDGKVFDADDAQLSLDKGTPRFYIMRLPRRGMVFSRITYHAHVTQCLGGLTPDPWYLTVSAPSGSVQRPPSADDLHAFSIPHGVFVKLHAGTWHAGPLFDSADHMDFYNLELADTNVTDHNTHDYQTQGFVLELQDERL